MSSKYDNAMTGPEMAVEVSKVEDDFLALALRIKKLHAPHYPPNADALDTPMRWANIAITDIQVACGSLRRAAFGGARSPASVGHGSPD